MQSWLFAINDLVRNVGAAIAVGHKFVADAKRLRVEETCTRARDHEVEAALNFMKTVNSCCSNRVSHHESGFW